MTQKAIWEVNCKQADNSTRRNKVTSKVPETSKLTTKEESSQAQDDPKPLGSF